MAKVRTSLMSHASLNAGAKKDNVAGFDYEPAENILR